MKKLISLIFLLLATPAAAFNRSAGASGGGTGTVTSVTCQGGLTCTGSTSVVVSTNSTLQNSIAPPTTGYSYNNSGAAPVVNLTTGSLTVGGVTAAVSTITDQGLYLPQIASPDTILGHLAFSTNGQLQFANAGGTLSVVSTATTSGGVTGITSSSAAITIGQATQGIFISSTMVVGATAPGFQYKFYVGDGVPRAANAGASTQYAGYFEHAGPTQLCVIDNSDNVENCLTATSSGGNNFSNIGTNISGHLMKISGGNNTEGIRVTGTGAVGIAQGALIGDVNATLQVLSTSPASNYSVVKVQNTGLIDLFKIHTSSEVTMACVTAATLRTMTPINNVTGQVSYAINCNDFDFYIGTGATIDSWRNERTGTGP